ncbi:hypothetical protein [Hahella ganghwensis]|uniref:hypothetical protein n=1 Tax=Hahella ganghwensis TaxID=286420 RepID=UPI00047562C2|nr:hypothetical protein [Hahella ganghwensis]
MINKQLYFLAESYNFRTLLSLIFCMTTWFCIFYADSYSMYSWNEHSLDSVTQPTARKFIITDYMNSLGNSPIEIMYFIPFFVVSVSRQHPFIGVFWLLFSLFTAVFSVAVIGEGGDRTGCKVCAIPYILLFILSPVVSIHFLYIFFKHTSKKKQPIRS